MEFQIGSLELAEDKASTVYDQKVVNYNDITSFVFNCHGFDFEAEVTVQGTKLMVRT